MQRLISSYQADPLREKLRDVFGLDAAPEPQHRQCLLLVVTHNITTDSPWPISSNPDAVFNDPSLRDCKFRIPPCQLVQVSAAAPVCFPPGILKWDPDDESKAFVFVDRGGTPYNNPAFLL